MQGVTLVWLALFTFEYADVTSGMYPIEALK